jgi:diguanylate cyclase (GGDEF)-like protein
VNDRYGHRAGDQVLAQIADVLRATCRESDTIARWGGEEFLVILRCSNRGVAPISAERIRMAIENHVFAIGGDQTLGVTCSIGFAPFPFSVSRPDEVSWEQVIALADDALYRAKQGGRNSWAGPGRTPRPWRPRAQTRQGLCIRRGMAGTHSSTLDRPHVRSGARSRRQPTRVERARAKFLRFFPGGFHDETYLEWERDYKW